MTRGMRLAGVGALVGALALGDVAVGTAQASSPPASIEVTVGAKQQASTRGAFRVEQVPTATGRTRVKITTGTNAVSVSAAPGSVVQASFSFGAAAKDGTRAGSAEVGVTPPSDAGVDPMSVVRAYGASGRSVITDAMETGMTYEEAMAGFGDMDRASNPTKAAATGVVQGAGTALAGTALKTSTAMTDAQKASTAQAVSSPNLLTAATAYDSWCTDSSANGGDQTAHACIIRYLDYSSGGLRYWTHKQKVTAKDNSFWKVMSSITQWYLAPTGNTVVDWDPWMTQSLGSCNASVVKTNPGYSSNGTLKVAMSWRLN